jgi:hypothetical protein
MANLTPEQQEVLVAFEQFDKLIQTCSLPVPQAVKLANAFQGIAMAVDKALQLKYAVRAELRQMDAESNLKVVQDERAEAEDDAPPANPGLPTVQWPI